MNIMSIEPYDDPSIKDSDLLIRRVDPEQHLVLDENIGKKRISSKLFSPSSMPPQGMSVDVERLIKLDYLDPKEFVTTPKHIGSVCFEAQVIRKEGFRVGMNPIINMPKVTDNPYHAEVWGPPARPHHFTKAQKKKLHQACQWFVSIPDVAIR